MSESERSWHDAAQLFPLMQDEEYEQLKADILANGLLEPIWLDKDGAILDGRNRHRACIETGTQPRFQTWDGHGSAVALVVSMNLHRRHLTSSQRAATAIKILPLLEAEAKERMLAGVAPDPVEIIPQGTGKARDQAAELFNTNGRYVSDAKTLQDEEPDLFERVMDGELTIPQAKRVFNQHNKVEPPPMEGKYRVIYVDPPWHYGNSGIIGESDHYGHVHRHYPSMTIKEMCDLPVGDLAENNAVLFLWVTSPLLEECFAVIDAWGFKYKTSFVWDKVGHNFGHYNSVRHELLLVCVRGSCTPDNSKLYDSVQSIEKSQNHSEKPQEFRNIIDDLYQHGSRIELFARLDVGGWDTWGNEATNV